MGVNEIVVLSGKGGTGKTTVAGAQDLVRILGLAAHFGVRTLGCLNKCDLSETRAAEIESLCASRGTPVAARVPFDLAVIRAMAAGLAVTEMGEGPVAEALRGLWRECRRYLGDGPVAADRTSAAGR